MAVRRGIMDFWYAVPSVNVPRGRNNTSGGKFFRIREVKVLFTVPGTLFSGMRDDDTLETTDDSELIRAAQAGDLESYERLVNRYQAGVRAFAAVRIPMRYEAEDLAQEAFVIAWRKLGDFEAGTSFGAWLKTITHRLVLNHRRKFRAEGVGGHRELEELLRERSMVAVDDASERLEALRECLSAMDGPALKLLNARYLDGETVREIAASTGRGYSALTMQLFRLREILAACVENEMERTVES